MCIIVYRYLIEVHVKENNYSDKICTYTHISCEHVHQSRSSEVYPVHAKPRGNYISQCMIRHTYMNFAKKKSLDLCTCLSLIPRPSQTLKNTGRPGYIQEVTFVYDLH